ncbi:cilia- and flagella-associated protein 74 isoform X2 [Rhineura floridana]|uniref:cilia- and flagella-associated protein 74 isoform X2 n=1 Tax=Rhineura floridana TaxID=261503 RepID=UPI002AC854AF|nr:cilia- and flagella-associated protein 74 isoform X2 [Rhineura floridana]
MNQLDQMHDMEACGISEENLSLELSFVDEENEEETGAADQLMEEKESWKGPELEDDFEVGEEEVAHRDSKEALEGAGEDLDSGRESSERPMTPRSRRTMNYVDRVRVLNLRRNLNQLDNLAKEKEAVIRKTREELNACHVRIEALTTQQRDVKSGIESEKESGNTAAVFRLQALHRRLCAELGNEKDLESKITEMLNENVLEMWKIEIEQGNFSELRKQIRKDEEELDQQRQEQAAERLQKQKGRAQQLSRRWLAMERKIQETKEDYEQRLSKALEDAQRNHERAVQFLKNSLGRVREKEASEEQKRQEFMHKRMETVLSLKSSISSNREKLRTLQARKKADACDAQEQDQKMKEAIQAQGHNVTREAFLFKRQGEFERRKKEFMEQQKARKMEIVTRILKEEAQLERVRKQSHPRIPKRQDKLSDATKWRMKTWRYIERACDDSVAVVTQKSWRSPSPCASLDDRNFMLEASRETVPESKDQEEKEEEENDEDETLAEPEFVGIWNQECNLSKMIDNGIDSKPLGASKLEKEIFSQNLEKLHSSIIHKHKVCGREFKGCPFYSKPSLIHFKDFDIGKTYKKKMVLINAFYSINYCKLVGVSEHLKNFITVLFDPPGPMSAGMSCEVGVTFKPMINEDLEGEVTFLSQIGSFAIPLKCSTKKCVLALDKELIDFGTHVVGETISRTITLTNCGALGTRFQLCKSADAHPAHAAMVPHTPTEPPSTKTMVCVPVVEATVGPEKGSGISLMGCLADKETVSLNRSEEVIQHTVLPDRLRLSPTLSNIEHFGRIASGMDTAEIIPQSCLDATPVEHPLSMEEVTEIRLGKVTEGEIGPFSSIKLQIIFTPAIPGDAQADFEITFDNPDCKPLRFSAIAVSVAVPVWVPNSDVDLKICMYDRLYQDCIIVQSRASIALRLKFDVCKELANHMELLPKTGYIQAHSLFSVQLKFLPRLSLPEDAKKYFDEKTGVLEVPMTIIVSDQSKPVEFTVHAIVTPSDLEISPTEVDFGFCSIYEAVQTTIVLTNKGILPQEFGFVGLPEFVEIQPNDGFGILLPLESLNLDIIFKAKQAKEYSFDLTCKTEINRKFKLSCKAVGVYPPLELFHSLVQFSATALNDVSTAHLFVINSLASLNQFTRSVPRTGKKEMAPVGPTSFQFLVPEDSPITIMPCVGTVLPGKKCLLEVSFRPVLGDQLIRMEAIHLLCQAAEAKAQMERKARELELQRRKEEAMMGRKDGKKQSSISFLSQASKDKNSPRPFEPPSPEDICPDSEEYIAAHLSLVRNFANRFDRYVIPCLVASGDIDEKRGAEDLQYSPHYTLYLELHCPAVAPAVVVMSNNGKTLFTFGDVAVGHKIKKEVKIQNISQEPLILGYSFLNPFGPFMLANPISTLGEGESRELVISFCPEESKPFFETLEIRSGKATLTLTLTGQGVVPSIACSVEGDVFNMGYIVAKETATSTFKIENTSTLPLKYSIFLESLSPNRDREHQKLPPFLASPEITDLVGTQNYSGLSVFSVSPVEGTICFGKCQEFTVTFSPDHESLFYSDCIQVVIFGKEVIRVIQLKGAARNHMMFVEGGDPLDVPIESLAITTSVAEEAAKSESDRATNSILLNLECVQSETFVIPAIRELKVGGIRTAQFASKKNVEYSWENMQLLQLKGFTIDPVKGTVERGQTKSISVSWVPPAGSNPNQPVTGSAILTVKGDVKEVYSVYFMGRIVAK